MDFHVHMEQFDGVEMAREVEKKSVHGTKDGFLTCLTLPAGDRDVQCAFPHNQNAHT